ncbi:ABC-three component system middle component 2 [Nocardioides sp. NPDC059952]|uniref:ABC-three component system middle component 2 n=1 Tax=Nocardioides sp. NPDC059952 TaxID=3347014 RepID=UPI00364A8AAA
METLNSPLELGLRALVLLTTSYPRSFDIDRLVLMDYCLIHSGDLGGPPSVLPPVPNRGGELGLKRSILEHGVQLMTRARMVDVEMTSEGITYRASEEAAPFLRLVDSPLMPVLTDVAMWVATEFGEQSIEEFREIIWTVASQWNEQWNDDGFGDLVASADSPVGDEGGLT